MSGQPLNWLGCDFVDAALASISAAWDQHCVALTSKINDVWPLAKEESDWTTDDESYKSVATIGDETYHKMTVKKQKKRKPTEYFTPSIPRKSKRVTPATVNKCDSGNKLSKASSTSSATTITSVGRSDSTKGKRATPKINTPDTKILTASAAKRRLIEEEKREAALALMKEKEEKAIQAKQENLKMKARITKLRNDEKRKKIEQIKAKEEEELKEKRLREISKTEEIEKRRREKEEARKREAVRIQDAIKKKQLDFELRKQQEEEERKARLLKLEEQNRQKKEENERIKKEEEKMMRLIAKHNSNFYDNKKVHTSATQLKVDQPAVAVPTNSNFKQPLPPIHSQKQPQPSPSSINKTFDKEPESVKKEAKPQIKVESYQITPPPKPKPMPVNYDISDIKSDDDTDDEERPKKLIPSWAKGDALIAALDKQFAKSKRARERQIREIFPSYDFSIQLADIFKSNRIVHPKYDKRTSSAVWSSSPCSMFNCSMLTDDC